MNKTSWKDTEEFFTSYLEKMGRAWWVEIITAPPKCIYYFEPFASSYEAQKKQAMNTNLNKQQNQLLIETYFSRTSNEFDFKEWASEVRKQMIASLEKRRTQRDKK
jgi:hypothetical protein